jgi:hypothetical protein
LQRSSAVVALTAEIMNRSNPGDSDCHVNRASAPSTSERVRHDDANAASGVSRNPRPKFLGRGVRIRGQDDYDVVVRSIRRIDATTGAYEAVVRLRHQERASSAYD